jgi:hypothetical protein
VTTHYTSMHSAIKMLNMRIDAIAQYLEGVSDGTTKQDHALLRQIASLTRQLPAVDTQRFQEDFLTVRARRGGSPFASVGARVDGRLRGSC